MRCLSCGYPLSEIKGAACPECGRRFDPADPASFDHTTRVESPNARAAHRILRWATALATFPILVNLLAAVGCWLIATVALGHPPRPSADDPKGIPQIALPYAAWVVSGIGCLAWPAIPVLAAMLSAVRGGGLRAQRWSLSVAIGAMVVWGAAAMMALSRVTVWLAD